MTPQLLASVSTAGIRAAPSSPMEETPGSGAQGYQSPRVPQGDLPFAPGKPSYTAAGNLLLVPRSASSSLPTSQSLGWNLPMALATMLTRSVISFSPTPASARAPATCTHTEISPNGQRVTVALEG